jgi:hypothetical protein
MLWKTCRFCHMECGKIGFAVLGFFYDFIRITQVTGLKHKEVKNLIQHRPLESFECSQWGPRDLHMGPWGKLGFTPVPSTVGASSPAARCGQGMQTNEGGRRFGSHGVDQCRWFGQSSARWCPVVRQRWRLRCGMGSDEMWGGARACVAVGARVEARE